MTVGTEVLTIIHLLRTLTPELVRLVSDLGSLADGEDLPVERLRELRDRGNQLSSDLDDLIARRESEGS